MASMQSSRLPARNPAFRVDSERISNSNIRHQACNADSFQDFKSQFERPNTSPRAGYFRANSDLDYSSNDALDPNIYQCFKIYNTNADAQATQDRTKSAACENFIKTEINRLFNTDYCHATLDQDFDGDVLSATITEYQSVLHVGHFDLDDINVQLIHGSGDRFGKKLVVHCFRIEPIQGLTGNYLKKEFKRELLLPIHADANTVESFYHNEMLTIKCRMKTKNKIPVRSVSSSRSRTDLFQKNSNVHQSPTANRSILKSNSNVHYRSQQLPAEFSPPSRNIEHDVEKKVHFAINKPTIDINAVNSRHRVEDLIRMDSQSIHDGFNCLTRDGFGVLYLTFVFRLPACTPADRCQVKIKTHDTLKLKIIQENRLGDILESRQEDLDTRPVDGDKILLREFSRRCRLPIDLFEFDESGVTLSFINDAFIKVDVPITRQKTDYCDNTDDNS
jgi:hypothetical protein